MAAVRWIRDCYFLQAGCNVWQGTEKNVKIGTADVKFGMHVQKKLRRMNCNMGTHSLY